MLNTEEENDDGFLACYLYLKNKERFEDAVDRLNITAWNHKLFAESRRHYSQAVDLLLTMDEIDKAARVCRHHGDFHRAGETYEEWDELILAGRDYREGKFYADAIRCFKKAGDQPGVARVYERMAELDKAIAIWKKLGKTREVNRVLKKKRKAMDKRDQMKLFQ